MFSLWKAPSSLRDLHPEAFQVAFGAVILFALGIGLLAFVWTYRRQRDDYGSAHWQIKAELKKNDMLRPVGTGFVLGKLGTPKSLGAFISSRDIPHVMMVAPTRAGMGVGFVIPNILAFGGSAVILDVKGKNFDKTAHYRMANGDEVYRFSPFDWANGTIATTRWCGLPRLGHVSCSSPRAARTVPVTASRIVTLSPSKMARQLLA